MDEIFFWMPESLWLDDVNGPQTQSFAYDALQRLISASALGGQNGLYNESVVNDNRYPYAGDFVSRGINLHLQFIIK